MTTTKRLGQRVNRLRKVGVPAQIRRRDDNTIAVRAFAPWHPGGHWVLTDEEVSDIVREVKQRREDEEAAAA